MRKTTHIYIIALAFLTKENSTHLRRTHIWHREKDGYWDRKFAPYIISQEQYERVELAIRRAPKYSAGSEDWLAAQEMIYFEMWRIIFPRDRFPDMEEPEDPCK